MSAVQRFLEQLDTVKASGDGWTARCPAHDDRHASLTVAVGEEGRVLVCCHAGDGCPVDRIVAALGLTEADLFERRNGNRRITATYDYVCEAGELLYQVVRFEPKDFRQRRPDGRGGWAWKLGDTRRVLYRLPIVLGAIKLDAPIYIAEGEKDVLALEDAGVAATCNPMGAGKWRNDFSETLRDADVVLVADRDEEGRKHAAAVARSLDGVARTVRTVEAAAGKDAADHLAAGLGVDDFQPIAPVGASETSESPRPTVQPASLQVISSRKANPRTIREAPPLATQTNILGRFEHDLRLAGVAGEQRLAKITYLALTSRLLPWATATNRPVSVIAKGTSSTGKSYTTQTVLRFFPSSAYLDLGSMSKRYLLYSEESLEHRFIVVPEASSIAGDDEILTVLRTLLSEGRVTHGTVDGDTKRTARRIEKLGPTGLLITTTAAAVDSELETRCLSLTIDDSPEQTRRVFETLAELEMEAEGSLVHFASWHELQAWLADSGEHRVVVPFIGALARLMPNGATRLRRDFVSLLCLLRAHALLHQANRQRDEHGRVVATVDEDYAVIRVLAGDLLAEGADAGVTDALRETVETVRQLLEEAPAGVQHVTVRGIGDRLKIGMPATYDRVRRALFAGYLVDTSPSTERAKRIVLGAELPGDSSDYLPAPERVLELHLGRVSDSASETANLDVEPGFDLFSDARTSRTELREAGR